MIHAATDIIDPAVAGTLAGLFRERVRRSPEAVAYRHCVTPQNVWPETTWAEMARQVARWQAALEREECAPGERVAILLRNCREWVMFDQAALGLGLVVVPLYLDDSAENIAYILNDAGARLVLFEGAEHWRRLYEVHERLGEVRRFASLDSLAGEPHDPRLRWVQEWLPADGGELRARDADPDALATIVYTSGTTGRCKGVMLSHRNILWNAHAALQYVPAAPADVFLSFLPLCHTLERTVGYYLAMMAGATVAYARSIPQLGEDLMMVKPTVLISVPRIFERVYNRVQEQLQKKSTLARRLFDVTVAVGWSHFEHGQGRDAWHTSHLLLPLLRALVARRILARLGGRLRVAIVGGAPLSTPLARFFIGLGLPLIQGYGLTETSPVISANKADDNDPASVGLPLPQVETRINETDGELLVRSPGVMPGYWNNAAATAGMIDAEGWLHTGDKARLEHGHLYITGRLKEIIVLANGKKIPPAEMELAILLDPLFEQVMVVGEGRPFLSVLAVPNAEPWRVLCAELGLNPDDPATPGNRALLTRVLERITAQLHAFPGFAQPRRVAISLTPWIVNNGLLTPTLKLKRQQIAAQFSERIERLYDGH